MEVVYASAIRQPLANLIVEVLERHISSCLDDDDELAALATDLLTELQEQFRITKRTQKEKHQC